jgi:hypothetical protein
MRNVEVFQDCVNAKRSPDGTLLKDADGLRFLIGFQVNLQVNELKFRSYFERSHFPPEERSPKTVIKGTIKALSLPVNFWKN